MFPICTEPGSSITVSGVIVPVDRAASAVMSLNVDPVGYPLWIARLIRGAPVFSLLSFLKVDSLSGLAKMLGSKLG